MKKRRDFHILYSEKRQRCLRIHKVEFEMCHLFSSSEEADQNQPNRKIEKRPLSDSQDVPNATVTRRSRYSTPSPVSALADVPLSIFLPSTPSAKPPSAGSLYASPFESVQSTVNPLYYPSSTPVHPQPNASDTPSQVRPT